MNQELHDIEYALTPSAFANRILAFNRLVPDLILLKNASAASLAYNIHEVAVVKFVRAQQQLIVCQLVGASLVVTLETDLVKVVLLNLVQLLELSTLTLAWCGPAFGSIACLPLFEAWCTEVNFANVTLATLHDNVIAECAVKGLAQVVSA